MVRDAIHGPASEPYFFIGNVALIVLWSVYLFGYAAAITFALLGAFCGLCGIVMLASLDKVDAWLRRRDQRKRARHSA
jgi:hypothetical protein